LGWRSQERLANPRTPAERLAQGILPQLQAANKVKKKREKKRKLLDRLFLIKYICPASASSEINAKYCVKIIYVIVDVTIFFTSASLAFPFSLQIDIHEYINPVHLELLTTFTREFCKLDSSIDNMTPNM